MAIKQDKTTLRELSAELHNGEYYQDDIAAEFLSELTEWIRYPEGDSVVDEGYGFAWVIKTLAGNHRRDAQQLSQYAKMLSGPLRDIPPYINHADALTATLARWRLKQGV